MMGLECNADLGWVTIAAMRRGRQVDHVSLMIVLLPCGQLGQHVPLKPSVAYLAIKPEPAHHILLGHSVRGLLFNLVLVQLAVSLERKKIAL